MSQKRLQFVLIDDDLEDLEMLQFGITQKLSDADIQCYTSAHTALEKLKSAKKTGTPDLIMVDYNMPKLQGLDFIKIIRESHNLQHLPVIMYSTDVRNINKEMQQKWNFLAMSKSNSLEELMDCVETMIDIAQSNGTHIGADA